MASIEIYTPKSKNMPDVAWLVFNCLDDEKKRSCKAFCRKYPGKWQKVASKMKTGIMELFHYPPDKYTAFFVNHLAKQVDKRVTATEIQP